MAPSSSRHRDGSGERRRVAVLGATGAVGQRFVRLLENHPWFEIAELAASERSAGRAYGEAVRWVTPGQMPRSLAGKTIVACDPSAVSSDIVFSALDSSVAGDAEMAFARAGKTVLTNAKNHRMAPDVPLVIAEVNPGHLRVLQSQRRQRKWSGAIIANGNCSAIVTTLALAPIHERFGISEVFVSTMQAVSGAGYPGVPSLDILGNVIPFINDEEDKLESEVRKFLGTAASDEIDLAPMTVSAHCNRVPVETGHTVCVSVRLRERASAQEVEDAIRQWQGAPEARGLPSSPEAAVEVSDLPDRPQPRRDVMRGNGMTVTVGRIRPDTLFDVKLVATGDNVVRGAAGASVLNAELMVNCGLLPR
ncbi:MAG TPA: aspartate-semialdehyde dehydrogenase [Gemmatimonadaceae bacterium]|jgi:aspartate-semialdehyde dehydrogenase